MLSNLVRACQAGCCAALASLLACSTSDQAAETAAPTAPTEVRTDADRRAIYNGSSGRSSPVPDATPNRVRLGEQAADINRRKRIETLNTDDPNTTTPETRLQRLDYGTPPDTTSRRP